MGATIGTGYKGFSTTTYSLSSLEDRIVSNKLNDYEEIDYGQYEETYTVNSDKTNTQKEVTDKKKEMVANSS